MKRLRALGQFGYNPRNPMNIGSTLHPLCNNVAPRYYSNDKDEDTVSEIGEKARSTAEEFVRVAKEKSDQISEGTRQTLHETKEAVLGESEDEEEKFKERVDKGKYHNQN